MLSDSLLKPVSLFCFQDVTASPVDTHPAPVKLRASPSIAQLARQSLINNPLAGQMSGKTIKSTSSARTTALNFSKSPFRKSPFRKSPDNSKASPSKPKTIFKSQMGVTNKTPSKSDSSSSGKNSPKFFGSSKAKTEISLSMSKTSSTVEKPLRGLALLAKNHKRPSNTSLQHQNISSSSSSCSSIFSSDKSNPGSSFSKVFGSQTKLSSGAPIPLKTYGASSNQTQLKTYGSPHSQYKVSSRGTSPSKKTPVLPSNKKQVIKKGAKDSSSESEAGESELGKY